MRWMSHSRCRSKASPRRIHYRPQLFALEDRVPLGDVLLGAVLGPAVLGPGLALDAVLAAETVSTAVPAAGSLDAGPGRETLPAAVPSDLSALVTLSPAGAGQTPRRRLPTSATPVPGRGSAQTEAFLLGDPRFLGVIRGGVVETMAAPLLPPDARFGVGETGLASVWADAGLSPVLHSAEPAGLAGLAAWAGLAFSRSAPSSAAGPADPSPLRFDPATGLLAIRAETSGAVREGVSARGFLEVMLADGRHSSDQASAWFDPVLAGATAANLSGVRLEGGGQAGLLLDAQTLAGGFNISADGPVTVTGAVEAAGPVAIAASAISVRGRLQGEAVDLASPGLVNVTATGVVRAERVAVAAGVFIHVGQIRTDGPGGGQVLIQAGNILQGGRISADGAAADGGTVQVGFRGSYLATAAAVTSADGSQGGRVTIDGGATGRLFSSGTQEALGRAAPGGSVALGGRDVVLAGATVDASGRARGGHVTVGRGFPEAGPDGAAARTVTVTAATLRAEALGGGSSGRVEVGAAPGRAVVAAPGFHLIDPHPTRAGAFGFTITPLSNGNLVVTNPHDDLVAADGGAVYLFQGQTGALLGTLVGGEAQDRLGATDGVDAGPGADRSGPGPSGPGPVGNSVVALKNGNYVVVSPRWNGDRGAATFGDGTFGITGTVDDTNSLVGDHPNDGLGSGGVTALSNGNYVVNSPDWNGRRGAVNWGYSLGGLTGFVEDNYPLVGTNPGDAAGSDGVTVLSNDNYVVSSSHWNGGRGAVTWGDGTAGVWGEIDASNSLVGSHPNDFVGGYPITALGNSPALGNGNYVVRTPDWNDGRGAVTHGNGTWGSTGTVDASNSLVGTTGGFFGDHVGSGGITALSNGYYVVRSPQWNSRRGAVTWGYGAGGVDASNSIVGSNPGDDVGSDGVTALSNGNYVVRSTHWNGALGAVTWGPGFAPFPVIVSARNSIVGSNPGDDVGSDGVTALSNGNYVVRSTHWNGALGAVTWGSGGTCCFWVTGIVSASNSLVGSNPYDYVGLNGVTALSNGNYVVASANWNGERGAVTWGDGTAGVTGIVSATNSLVGSNPYDEVGLHAVTVLTNGHYVVSSPYWNGGRGAVTWGSGTCCLTGIVSASNSLVGSNPLDQIGFDGVTVLSNGNYVVRSQYWNGHRGAVTWGDGTAGVTGTVNVFNSLIGSNPDDFVGDGVTALRDGDGNSGYVVVSFHWNGGRGAATWSSGIRGLTGVVDFLNSLFGDPGDYVGFDGVTALSNGNYVVSSSHWNGDRGAVTWGDDSFGVTGFVSADNSLVGSNPNDRVGLLGFRSGVTVLSNGDYVVNTPQWNGSRGAATWLGGGFGVTGIVSATNSLVGSNPNDRVGLYVTALTNGHYVVGSPHWNGDRGAVTFGSGGLTGYVDGILNSLVGSNANDRVGWEVTALNNGNYVVRSPFWNGNRGAVTLGDGLNTMTGEVNGDNSLVG